MDIKTVYLDYAASTPLDAEVSKVMTDAGREYYANPSSLHYPGQQSKVVLEKSRRSIADSIGAESRQIVFTSGGTESNNLALLGISRAYRSRGNHIITTGVEHPSVLECCKFLTGQGYRITYLKVNEQGQIDLNELLSVISDDTILVSVMMANNETGCLLPVREIGRILRPRKIPFHCDAVQAFGKIDFTVQDLNIDLLTLSAHKIYGPKGIAALYIGDDLPLENIVYGGSQERNRRAGTENLIAIIGFAAAVQQLDRNKSEREQIAGLRDHFEDELRRNIPGVQINGGNGPRLFSHSNVFFPFINGESLMMSLDLQGIAISVGSACSSGSPRPSHVLTAMGLEPQWVSSSVRFSLGRFTTAREIDYTLNTLVRLYQERSKVA